ncbi:hypothetical protein [Francisella tularensis]|uniref:hypothetical protein n=1 Tax=Francisella tularensis TaxID=263 RepID=UPI0008F46739|nr:hypothetical protein [Francisella tularensis]APA83273.1 hypothetical protein N894_1289 [Francisella tularensis subsp. novicida PA10-7858]
MRHYIKVYDNIAKQQYKCAAVFESDFKKIANFKKNYENKNNIFNNNIFAKNWSKYKSLDNEAICLDRGSGLELVS